jgi:minor extracellular serine protease Vpr
VKKKVAILAVVPLLMAGIAAGQQIVPGRYIVELSGAPVAAASKDSQNARRAAVQTQQSRVRAALAASAVNVTDSVETVANALFVNASEAQAVQIAQTPGVLRVTPVKLYKKLLDRAVFIEKGSDAWAQLGGQGVAGLGVKIGIIDTGIDSSHPGFSDGSLVMPDGFPKVNRDIDLRNTNNKVIVARNYDRQNTAKDVEGHGTGVAMIAAGMTASGSRATITGIAPKAYLGNYKVFPDDQDGAPTDAVLKALDDAINDGMDVINLSLGSFPAERFSEDPLAQAVERTANMGVIVVIAAGNEGPDMDTIASPATAPSVISVGNAFTDRIFASVASFDSAVFIAIPGSGRNTNLPVVASIVDIATLDPSGLACSPLPDGSLSGKIAFILRGTCFFEEKLNNVQRAGAIAALVYTHAQEPSALTMEVGQAQLPAAMVSNADGLRIRERIGASPDALMTIDFVPKAVSVDPSRLSDSTSKGPNNDFAIKPDLLAVGTSVYTASTNSGFIAGSGTSFSSPMVAGAAALLKAARPGLTAQQYRSLLINTASTFGSGIPLQQTGTGMLNVVSALNGTIAANPQSITFGAGGGTADLNRTLRLQNVGQNADTYTLTVTPTAEVAAPALSANSIQLAPGASAEVTLRFQGNNLPARSYEGVVVVRGTQTSVETRVPYWYAVPSQEAAIISVVAPETSGAPGSRQKLRFRVLDSSGVPQLGEPKVTATQGGGAVLSVESLDSLYPGLFVADVRLGALAGGNVFVIEAGGIAKQISITGQ